MRIQNIGNFGRKVFLFCREEDGSLSIKTDNSFFPYYYAESEVPTDKKSYITNKYVKKVFCSDPKELKSRIAPDTWEADIKYDKRYLIDKVPEITKSNTKYLFIDIETLSSKFPDILVANDTISCISSYNNLSKEYKQFFLNDYEGQLKYKETQLLNWFIDYVSKEKVDLILAWNMVGFDYPYLMNRIKNRFAKNFAQCISPINLTRWNNGYDHPVGVSIIDYMELYKKFTLCRKQGYALDAVLQNEFGIGKKHKNVDFGELNDTIKERNLEDVQGMVKIEEKYNLIEYFDAIRRKVKCTWEDLPSQIVANDDKKAWYSNNSRTVDIICLNEATKQNIVLPNKIKSDEEFEFQGAFREAFKVGRFKNVVSVDLSSAYPYSIVDFCLDSANIKDGGLKIDIKDRLTNEITKTYYYEQNVNSLLPSVVRQLLTNKEKVKVELKTLDINSPEYKTKEIEYASEKSIINSCFGVFGLPSFRLFDGRIAETITFLVRDLLHYCTDKIQEEGYEVIYVDTDALMVNNCTFDISIRLNELVQQWAKERFNKDHTDIHFDFEGVYEKLFITAKCRYRGYLRTKSGLECKTKGLEIKRNDSTKFMSHFQEELLEKIMNFESEESIKQWIETEKIRMRTLPLLEVSFPCKINKVYTKNTPIFRRALDYTQEINLSFQPVNGEVFYYCFVEPFGKDAKNKKKDVIAFNEDNMSNMVVDWKQMEKRNINLKVQTIFEVLGWKYE